jgi:hypothetical protein
MAQHMQINKHNTAHTQNKEKNHIISIDAEGALNKFNIPS